MGSLSVKKSVTNISRSLGHL